MVPIRIKRLEQIRESVSWREIPEDERSVRFYELLTKKNWTESDKVIFLLNQYLYRFGQTDMSHDDIDSTKFDREFIRRVLQECHRLLNLPEPDKNTMIGIPRKSKLDLGDTITVGQVDSKPKSFKIKTIGEAMSKKMASKKIRTIKDLEHMIGIILPSHKKKMMSDKSIKQLVIDMKEKSTEKKKSDEKDATFSDQFDLYYDKVIAPFEGGVSKDPDDSQSKCSKPGKAHTNKGLGICTAKGLFKQDKDKWSFLDKNEDGEIDHEDVELWETKDVKRVAYEEYWKYVGSHMIKDVRVSVLLCDWGWGSGPGTAVRKIRKMLNKEFDLGLKVSPRRLKKEEADQINELDQDELYEEMRDFRERDLKRIAGLRNNKKYLKGWMRRLNSLEELVT